MKSKFVNEKYIKNSHSTLYGRNKDKSFKKINIVDNTPFNCNNDALKKSKGCYGVECNSTNLAYDSKRDQLWCRDCGLVLREGFTDYKNLISDNTSEELLLPLSLNSYYSKDYLFDLFEIQEYKNKLDLINYR